MVQCPCCGTAVPPQSMVFSMRPQFQQVCQSCAASEQRTSIKAGTSGAYVKGAAVVGLFLLVLALRILARMMR